MWQWNSWRLRIENLAGYTIHFVSIPNHFCFCILDDDFKDFLKCMETDEKKIYLVDSGLSFNLPFPVTLRPQRGIELYITCDFSSRKSDSTPPFRVNFQSITDNCSLEKLVFKVHSIFKEVFAKFHLQDTWKV